MIFYIYSVYDPELEAFDARLNLAPFEPKDMAEQYRRTAAKMSPEQKIEADGKKVILMGEFDDVSGKIEQKKLLEIFTFKKDEEKIPEESSQVEEEKDSSNA